ncbi:MAG: WYL domain-containing protein [Actinomycetaceae bacterium]|nr:WYL domain-containing protein [Actinomycetaceae bacterium]
MSAQSSTHTRVLGLFFDLRASSQGKTKEELRTLAGYSSLDDKTFEAYFQRDKAALRDIGVTIHVSPHARRGEVYSLDPSTFADAEELTAVELWLIRMAISTWSDGENRSKELAPKLLARSDSDGWSPIDAPIVDLRGAEMVATLAGHIRAREVISFTYPSGSGHSERTVEPWNIIRRGRSLYLWCRDLDRDEERLFHIGRISSMPEVLGEPGDARLTPPDAPEPFEDFYVAPLLRIRPGVAGKLPLEDMNDIDYSAEWVKVRGARRSVGEWLTLVLRHGTQVIVEEPTSLRDGVLSRLHAALKRGGDA